ncbi:MAG: hypothetical protein AMXMBFR8_28660 [Nevskiales bacterium]
MKARTISKRPRPTTQASPPRAGKTPKGQRVMERVLVTARRLLQNQSARSVTVADIAKAAGLPRASVLLQFPDGLPEMVDHLIYQEYMAMFESDEIVDLMEAAERQATRRKLPPGLAAALLPLNRLVESAPEAGMLHANLTSEALLFEGSRLIEHRARLGMLGVVLVFRLCKPDQPINRRNIAFGEMLGRVAWDLAASRWYPADAADIERTDILRSVATALAPHITAQPRTRTH